MNAMSANTPAADYVDQIVTRGMRDGVEIHRAALEAGLSTRLYPRQVLEVLTPEGERATSFTHGIPQASTLSGVTFTQELHMGRGLLQKAGIRLPEGATFSVGYSKKAALRYGDKIGYPLVVKPALGDSTIDVVRGITSRSELSEAVETLRVPPEERPDNTVASYGITELRQPGLKDGKVTVPPGYRFYVQEEVSGAYYRIVVLDGEVISVVRCQGGPWGEHVELVAPEQWPAETQELAAQAVTALSGLAVLSVDIVVPDSDETEEYTAEGTEPVVVDVSERPWLEVQHRISPEQAHALAHRILRSGLGSDAPRAEPASSIDAQAHFFGVVDPAQFTDALQKVAAAWGITVQPVDRDETLGRVKAVLTGQPGAIAEMVEVILERGAQDQVAMRADLNNSPLDYSADHNRV